MYSIGFDIGGSSIKAVLVKDEQIIKSVIYDTPGRLEDLMVLIAKMRDELSSDLGAEAINGIGFGVAGTPDANREIMLNSPNIEYLNGQPLKKMLVEKLDFDRIKLEHDVHCFLLAEKKLGLAKNFKNLFYLTLGTGIGSAWMVEGKIFYGSHGAASESGHMVIEAEKAPDMDEFEELAANKFIIKMLGFGSNEAIKRARAGEKKPEEVLRQLGRNLGVGLGNIINAFDPEAIILSGGIAEAKEFILPGIREGIEKYVISPAAKKTQILFSELGRLGGALGAAMMFE